MIITSVTRSDQNEWKMSISKEKDGCPTEYIKNNFNKIAENTWQDEFGKI
jgi:hypothetical protein